MGQDFYDLDKEKVAIQAALGTFKTRNAHFQKENCLSGTW